MTWFVGVDVGGTFTDFFAFNLLTNEFVVHKTPSTPDNPSAAIAKGLEDVAQLKEVSLQETERFSHGTTVATNALLQRKGGKVALVTTRGFRDLIEIGRQIRPKVYSLQEDQPDHVVRRSERIEVNERILADGSVHCALTEKEVDSIIARVQALDADSCAICLLFSFLNDSHESRIAGRLRSVLPNLYVSTSSEVQPEFREYERMSTTVINAYLQPVMHRYLDSLREKLTNIIPRAQIGINQSTGGLMSLDRAIKFPVRTALSGPAAGAIGAVHVAAIAGHPNVVTLDMGGTSADVCLIRESSLGRTSEREINGLPIRMPVVDIHTIGAGGGSIAWFDKDGLLKVGPASAGAKPGPACYGHGGDRPTVSDANAVLGRLGGKGLLGGKMAIDVDAALRVIAPLAGRLALSIEEAAHGIIEIVNSNMVRAIRVVSVEKGHDPRELTLMPFGGAGGLHCSGVARSLGIRRVLVPLLPGILCAQGLIVSDLKEDFVRTIRALLDSTGLACLLDAVRDMRKSSEAWFSDEVIPPDSRSTELRAELRYVGQNYELSVPFHVTDDLRAFQQRLTSDFYSAHDRQYGFFTEGDPIQIVNVRLTATGSLKKPSSPSLGIAAQAEPKASSTRVVYFERQAIKTPVFDRDTLLPQHYVEGPAVIEQMDATTVLMPGDRAVVDGYLNLIIEVPYGR